MEYKLKEKDKLQGKPENKESFKSSSSIAQEAVIYINEHGLIVYWNKAAENLFGLREEDVLNKNLHLLIAPQRYLEAFKEGFIKFRNSGHGAAIGKTLELEGKKKNGEEFPIELSLSSFQVNGEWNAVGIIRDITKRKKAENTIKERIKELTCLYELSKIIEENDITKEEILKKSVNLIPPAWQYPDITCARIIVDSQEYKTKNFKETEWKQASDIFVNNNKVGLVEAYYLEKTPEFDEGSFLKEERYLINAMTERLGKEFERIKGEIKVKESEEWLYTTLKSIGDAVIATDSKGNVIFLNSVAESLTGWKQSEAIKKPVQEIFKIINVESREEVESPIDRVIHEGVIVGLANNTVLISKDGREIPIDDSGAPIKDNEGKINGVVLTFRDITERKKAEEKLRESEEKWRSLTEYSSDNILTADLDYNILFINQTVPGITIEEVIGQKLFMFVPEEFHESVKQCFERVLKSSQPDRYYTEYIGTDGSKTFFEARVAPRMKDGEIIGFTINGIDITERKRAEDTIKERIKELTCLYELSKIAGEKKFNVDSFLKEAIKLIPPAWQFPDITCARIQIEGKEYKTDNYKETKWHQISKIYIENQKIGEIEIGYLEETPIFDEGPFLKEERNLINGISEILSGVLELKLTEEKLKKSEANHRNMITNLDAAFYQVGLDGKLLNHNPAYNRILGYEPSLNLKNTNVKLLFENPKDNEVYIEQLLKNDFVKNYICHVLKKDGTKIVLQLNCHLDRDKEGKPVRTEGTFIDITEKFVLEQKLKGTFETTRKVLESLPMGIILVGYDGMVQSVNKVALNILEFNDVFEVLGKNWHTNLCPSEFNACPIIDLKKDDDRSETYLVSRSGREVPILKTVLPITLGEIDYLLEAFVDITTLKETQDKLKKNQEKYLALVETSSLGIMEFNLVDNIIEYLNPSLLEMTGYSSKELKSENYFFKIVHPEDLSKLLQSRDVKDVEFRIITKTSETKWIVATRFYNYNKKGEPVNLRLWLLDITERKKVEKLKEKFTEQLEKEVEHRTKDLRDLLEKQRLYLDQIEKASRFKTEFLATMSHELRTPMNAIIGFTDLLIEGVFGELNKEQKEYVKDIEGSSQHLLDMITHILNISKIESGHASLKIEEIHLNNLIDQVISTLKPFYSEKDIKLDIIGLRKEQFIIADRIKFKEIIYNLMSNAIKFTEKGKIVFEFKENKRDWEFIIKDTGIGIAEKDFSIIFKDFERVKSKFVDSTQGTGLGLALTKRIINIHGGDISFTSKLGKGTTFTFTLPKALKEKSPPRKKVEAFLNKL